MGNKAGRTRKANNSSKTRPGILFKFRPDDLALIQREARRAGLPATRLLWQGFLQHLGRSPDEDPEYQAILARIAEVCQPDPGAPQEIVPALDALAARMRLALKRYHGQIPAKDLAAFFKTALDLRKEGRTRAEVASEEVAQSQRGVFRPGEWEHRVAEARGYEYGRSPVETPPKTEPTRDVSDNTLVEEPVEEPHQPEDATIDPDDEPAAIIDKPEIQPSLSTEERTALEGRLREVEAILARPQSPAPRPSLNVLGMSGQDLENTRRRFYASDPAYLAWLRERQDREALSHEAVAIWWRLNRRGEQAV